LVPDCHANRIDANQSRSIPITGSLHAALQQRPVNWSSAGDVERGVFGKLLRNGRRISTPEADRADLLDAVERTTRSRCIAVLSGGVKRANTPRQLQHVEPVMRPLVGDEEYDAARDLFGLAEPADRHKRQDRLLQDILRYRLYHFGLM
jgi:hypothetical protein